MELNENDKWDWVGTIETSMGNYVNILDITPDMVVLDDIATSLSNICRFNGHLPSFYSVAEHSVRVAWWLTDQGFTADIALTGLLHDAAEAYVGDMMRPLKRVPEMEAVFKPIEDHAMQVVHHVLGGQFPHPYIIGLADKSVYEWEAANIRTGLVTGFAPDFARSLFLSCYAQLTNTNFDEDESILKDFYPPSSDADCCDFTEPAQKTPRRKLLEEAADLIDGDRNAQYGDPIDDFRRTATYWSTHLGGVFRRKANSLGIEPEGETLFILDNLLDPHDVAIMMGQLKDSRLAWDPYKQDTWADKAGYSACGYDCIVRDN